MIHLTLMFNQLTHFCNALIGHHISYMYYGTYNVGTFTHTHIHTHMYTDSLTDMVLDIMSYMIQWNVTI